VKLSAISFQLKKFKVQGSRFKVNFGLHPVLRRKTFLWVSKIRAGNDGSKIGRKIMGISHLVRGAHPALTLNFEL
jgi:hypothetical protein